MNNTYDTKKFNNLVEKGILKICSDYQLDHNTINNRDEFDSIYFNQSDFISNKNNVFLVINKKTHKFFLVYPSNNNDVNTKTCKLNRLASQALDYDYLNTEVYSIDSTYCLSINKVNVQSFNEIKDEIITLSSEHKHILNSESNYFIVKNKDNNSCFIVSKNHVKFSDKLVDNEIRLNRKQRILLGDVDLKASKLIICPYPSILLDQTSILKKIINRILKLYVGKVNIALISKRTYQSDESFNIVRISTDTMKLLGITDTDFVKITFLDSTYYSRVLPINDTNRIIEQNNDEKAVKIFDIENIIGIPASIRSELGIPSVLSNYTVKVERDMEYIFKKNINQQILPIILILFSTEIFVNGRQLLVKILIALISLPITLYFNLSNERSICK